MIDSWHYNLRYSSNPKQDFCVSLTDVKPLFKWVLPLVIHLCTCLISVQFCVCRVCVCACMWCLSLPDRMCIGFMLSDVIWHPLLWPLALAHDPENTSTPCNTSPVTPSARTHSSHQWKTHNGKHRKSDLKATSGGWMFQTTPLRPTEMQDSLFCSERGARTLHGGFLLLLPRPVALSVGLRSPFRVDECPPFTNLTTV